MQTQDTALRTGMGEGPVRPVLSQKPAGGLGNRMFVHLLALAILRRIPELELTGGRCRNGASGCPAWRCRTGT
jgi:hypothetical protein